MSPFFFIIHVRRRYYTKGKNMQRRARPSMHIDTPEWILFSVAKHNTGVDDAENGLQTHNLSTGYRRTRTASEKREQRALSLFDFCFFHLMKRWNAEPSLPSPPTTFIPALWNSSTTGNWKAHTFWLPNLAQPIFRFSARRDTKLSWVQARVKKPTDQLGTEVAVDRGDLRERFPDKLNDFDIGFDGGFLLLLYLKRCEPHTI